MNIISSQENEINENKIVIEKLRGDLNRSENAQIVLEK